MLFWPAQDFWSRARKRLSVLRIWMRGLLAQHTCACVWVCLVDKYSDWTKVCVAPCFELRCGTWGGKGEIRMSLKLPIFFLFSSSFVQMKSCRGQGCQKKSWEMFTTKGHAMVASTFQRKRRDPWASPDLECYKILRSTTHESQGSRVPEQPSPQSRTCKN